MPKSALIRAMGEFAASRDGTFTLSQAAENGLTRHDVRWLERSGFVVRVRRAVYRYTSSPATQRQLLYAATLGGRVAASHLSATALHRLDGLSAWPAVP